jgi:hypothetical protein
MGLFDNISDPSTSTSVPGGNVGKSLVIGVLSVLASRYMSGGSKELQLRLAQIPGQPRHQMPLPVTSSAALGAYSNSFRRMV